MKFTLDPGSLFVLVAFALAFAGAVRHLLRHGLCAECEAGCKACGGSCHGGTGCKATLAMAEKLRAKTEAARKGG